MAASDDFGFDDDDTEFLAAETQVEAWQDHDFESSPRPSKRRRLSGSRADGRTESNKLRSSEAGNEAENCEKTSLVNENEGTQLSTASNGDPEYYFPGELGGQDEESRRSSKYKIHIPRNGGQYKDRILTQTQHELDLSPSHFRGAVWKRVKPPPPPPPKLSEKVVHGNDAAQVNTRAPLAVLGPRQTTLNGFAVRSNGIVEDNVHQSDATLAARLQAEENACGQPANDVIEAVVEVHDELADLPSDAFLSSSRDSSPEKDVIMISSQQTASQAQIRGLRAPQQGLKQMTIFGKPATQDLTATQAANKRHAWPLKSRDEKPTHHKLDEKAMETWVYPTNLGTVRDYQYNIVSRSLYHNTLVALPTGLGKTFIAATVMLNYYRWTTNAQIVFMAPTKPLIAQQMEACYHIVGIPRRDTVLMTGETPPAVRTEEWLKRRVFFMTPQTVMNDLKSGICDPKKTVLVVVDEAHKATG